MTDAEYGKNYSPSFVDWDRSLRCCWNSAALVVLRAKTQFKREDRAGR
jgi:hypothetical protein